MTLIILICEYKNNLLVRFSVQIALNRGPDLFYLNRWSSSKFGDFLDRTESPVRGSQKFGLNRTEPDFGIPTRAVAAFENAAPSLETQPTLTTTVCSPVFLVLIYLLSLLNFIF